MKCNHFKHKRSFVSIKQLTIIVTHHLFLHARKVSSRNFTDFFFCSDSHIGVERAAVRLAPLERPVPLFLPRAAGGSKVLVDMRGQISFKGTLTRSDTHPCSPAVHTSDLSDICCSVKVTLGVGQRLGAPLSLFVRGRGG